MAGHLTFLVWCFIFEATFLSTTFVHTATEQLPEYYCSPYGQILVPRNEKNKYNKTKIRKLDLAVSQGIKVQGRDR